MVHARSKTIYRFNRINKAIDYFNVVSVSNSKIYYILLEKAAIQFRTNFGC